jgi:hypothetical protein
MWPAWLLGFKKMKKIIAVLLLPVLFVTNLPVACAAGNDCWSDTAKNDAATLQDIGCVFQIVFNYALRFAGLAVFIMLLVGGIKYLTAGGDPEKAAGAQKTLTYAIFGLALIIISWFILLLIESFTGIKVTVFEIPGT